MKVLLNDVPVEPPIGLDGLTLKKTRNPRYWGFLYRNLGFVPGFGEMTFSDPYAVRTIRDAFQKERLSAETSFKLVDEKGQLLYAAFVDYATLSFKPGEVRCSFRDEKSITELEAALTSVFSIPATQKVTLPGQPLASEATYTLNSTAVVSRVTSGSFLHSLPIHRTDEKNQAVPGELSSVSQPLALEAIYRNSTDKKVVLKLSGVVSVAVSASLSMNASLGYRIMNGTQVVSTTPLATYALDSVAQDIVAVLDTLVTVSPGQSLVVGWVEAGSTVISMVASYKAETAIGLTQPVTVPSTDCYGLYAYDLLKALQSRCQKEYSFVSEFFKREDGKTAFITNGANLRGIRKPIQTSLSDLFDGLNAIFNLGLKAIDNSLHVEDKGRILFGGTSILTEVLDVRYSVNTTFLASEVLAGYTNWKGESLTSAADPNGSRSYRTSITTFRNPVDLRSSLIAAGTLIEETRQKQFDPETSGSQKAEDHDDDLFIVMVDLMGRARATPFYNTEINPLANLRKWSGFLAYCGGLQLEAYEGALAANEKTTLKLFPELARIGDLTAVVEAPMSMADYAGLQDWIQFNDGETTRTGLLMDAEWSDSANGTVATLTLSC